MVQPKGKGLLIAEKSSAGNDFKEVYMKNKNKFDYELDIDWLHGHVTKTRTPDEMDKAWEEWKLEDLPLIPNSQQWELQPIPNDKRYQQVAERIRKGNYDFIINAGDFDREGHYIQEGFYDTLNLKIPVYRLWANDMSDDEIVKGLSNLIKSDEKISKNTGTPNDMKKAGYLRSQMDWLLGMNSSRLLTLRGGTTIRSGRVKMVILKIIADREIEIRDFVSKPFWTIKAIFKTTEGEYEGTLMDEEGNVKQFQSEDEAVKFFEELGSDYSIQEVTSKQENENPPQLYTMDTLQGDAANLFGLTPAATLDATQKLYEMKIVSYPRTNSEYIGSGEADKFLSALDSVLTIEQLSQFPAITEEQKSQFKNNLRYVNDKKVGAHSGLTVLHVPSINLSKLTEAQRNVLFLIGRSMLLSYQKPVVKLKTEILTSNGTHVFKTNGTVIKDKGWAEYVDTYSLTNQTLPKVEKGELVELKDKQLKEGKTSSPSRYNVSSLMSLLKNIHRLIEDDEEKLAMKEAEGIGTAATRTVIIDELVNNNYIEMKGKKQTYYATDLGVSLIESIGHTKLTNPSTTAQLETKLHQVENGTYSAEQLYTEIVEYTKEVIKELENTPLNLTGVKRGDKEPIGSYNGEDVYEASNGYYTQGFLNYMKKVELAKENNQALPEKEGLWVSKTIKNKKMSVKGSFSKKDLVNLLNGESVTKEVKWENGQTSKREFKLSNNSLEMVKSTGTPVEINEFVINGQTVTRISGTNEKGDFDFFKVNDKLTIQSVLFGNPVDKALLTRLLSGERVKLEGVSKAGNKLLVTVAVKDDKLVAKFEDNHDYIINEEGLKVQLIEGENAKGKYSFYKVNDTFTISPIYSGVEITKEVLKELVSKGYYESSEWVSKKGSNFTAKLVVKNNKVGFEFN